MGVVTIEIEAATSIPPAKMFKALAVDGNTLIPKVVPQAIKSIEILEGDGGPGTIRKITFGEGSKFKYAKQKVEGIDKENFTFNYSVIEGDALTNKLEKVIYETKFFPTADGGSICKNTSKYYTIGDNEIKEEEIKAGKAQTLGLYKAFEAYLLANPDAC